MKIAIVGSRTLSNIDFKKYLPENITEIISGGAKGIDACAKEYAIENHIAYKEFLPNYAKYGKSAPLKRNLQIIDYADIVLAFWNGKSKGTKFVIDNCEKYGKKVIVILT